MKVGILGGTFNPIHVGHLKIAEVALKKMKLNHVLFVPSSQPPHRLAQDLAPAQDRFEMVKQAVAGFPRFLPSLIEIERGGKSYTIETLRQLRKIYRKGTRFFFIVGSDALLELHAWRHMRLLSGLCEWVVLTRKGFPMKGLSAKKLSVPAAVFRRLTRHCIPIRPVLVSATEVRQRVREGRSLSGKVPKEVAKYIKEKRLYFKGGA